MHNNTAAIVRDLAMELAMATREEALEMVQSLREEVRRVYVDQLNYLLADYINKMAVEKGLCEAGEAYSGIATGMGDPAEEFRNELFLRKTLAMVKLGLPVG
jgi:hypothetical protein